MAGFSLLKDMWNERKHFKVRWHRIGSPLAHGAVLLLFTWIVGLPIALHNTALRHDMWFLMGFVTLYVLAMSLITLVNDNLIQAQDELIQVLRNNDLSAALAILGRITTEELGPSATLGLKVATPRGTDAQQLIVEIKFKSDETTKEKRANFMVRYSEETPTESQLLITLLRRPQ